MVSKAIILRFELTITNKLETTSLLLYSFALLL